MNHPILVAGRVVSKDRADFESLDYEKDTHLTVFVFGFNTSRTRAIHDARLPLAAPNEGETLA